MLAIWNHWLADAVSRHRLAPGVDPRELAAQLGPRVDLGTVLVMQGVLGASQLETLRRQAGPTQCSHCAAFLVGVSGSEAGGGAACPACGANLDGEGPSARFGHYEIFGLLGRGGAGMVYRARNTKTGADVALKVIRPERKASPTSLKRFLRESSLTSRLNHPAIVRVLETGDVDGTPFIAMELVEGETLSHLYKQGPLDPDRVLAIGWAIAEAMDHAHGLGVVHRDLKPANILIERENGHPKVLDFGLAKDTSGLLTTAITADGVTVGTAGYISPERIAEPNAPATPSSDIWALGALVYEGLYGRSAFPGRSFAEVADRVVAGKIDWKPPAGSPQVDARVKLILESCLAVEPEARYQRAGDIVGDFASVIEQRGPEELLAFRIVEDARKIRAVKQVTTKRKSNVAVAAVAGVLVGLVIAAVVLFLVLRSG